MPKQSTLISLRRHSIPRINQGDFAALKWFEKAHPELYVSARVAKYTSSGSMQQQMNNIVAQMNAFNAVFNHPDHKQELMALIEEARSQ